MNLVELHTILTSLDSEMRLDGIYSNPHSDRGYYNKVAIRKEEGESTVWDLLYLLEHDILNETFQGYKGGDFKMDYTSGIRIGYDSSCTGNEFITEIKAQKGIIKLYLTEYQERTRKEYL